MELDLWSVAAAALLCVLVFGWRKLLAWCRGVTFTGSTRLDGKLAVVTGANVGIGKAAATELARRGARVILACRDLGRAAAARREIMQEAAVAADKVETMQLDLASFKSVREFGRALCQKERSLDILVNNAGVAFTPRALTEDDLELVTQVNHLASFLLTNLLVDLLAAAGSSRVIMVSSLAHGWVDKPINYDDLNWETSKYSMTEVYGQSKLANILFAKEFGRRQHSSGIRTYSVHPGAVLTELGRDIKDKLPTLLVPVTDYLTSLFLMTPTGGAQTILYCAVEPELSRETGLYYADCAVKTPSQTAQSRQEAERLWQLSSETVGDITPVIIKTT